MEEVNGLEWALEVQSMNHPITIEIPEAVYRSLEKRAAEQGKTPAALAAEWVVASVGGDSEDPLLKWAGFIDSEISDVAERHDFYLGQALADELRGSTHE